MAGRADRDEGDALAALLECLQGGQPGPRGTPCRRPRVRPRVGVRVDVPAPLRAERREPARYAGSWTRASSSRDASRKGRRHDLVFGPECAHALHDGHEAGRPLGMAGTAVVLRQPGRPGDDERRHAGARNRPHDLTRMGSPRPMPMVRAPPSPGVTPYACLPCRRGWSTGPARSTAAHTRWCGWRGRSPNRGPARSVCACGRAASAGRTSTSPRATWSRAGRGSRRGTRSSGWSTGSVPAARGGGRVTASGCPGWPTPAASAASACPGRENLCLRPRFTGWDVDGGLRRVPRRGRGLRLQRCPTSSTTWRWRRCSAPGSSATGPCCGPTFPREAGSGIYGFGGSAHLTAQVALARGARVHVMTRSREAQQLALELGAASAGDADAAPPEPLDSAILFAPVGTLVPPALAALDRGGTLAIAGIYLSDIPALDYERAPVRGADPAERDRQHPARRGGVPGRGRPDRPARLDRPVPDGARRRKRCATCATTGSTAPPSWWSDQGKCLNRKRSKKRRRCPSRFTQSAVTGPLAIGPGAFDWGTHAGSAIRR